MPSQNRWKFAEKVVLIIVKTLLFSGMATALVLLLCTALRYTYFRGYLEGQKSMDEYLTQIFTQPDATSYVIEPGTPAPTKVPSPSVKKVSQGVIWGGPQLWEAVNGKRVEYGVNPLKQADELCTIASIRLNELLELGKLDGHEGFGNMTERRPDLKWIFEKYSTIAEFLAYGGLTPEETVGLWDNTLGHKKLLNGGEFVWGCIYAQNTFAVAITAY